MESERIPTTTQASDDGAYNNELVTHDEGTTDVGRQPVPHSPEMVRDPSATTETSIGRLSQELMGDGTSRVITALRDSPKQGKRRTTEEIAAMPVVAISLEDVELIATIRTSLLEAEDDNAIGLDLNEHAIPADLIQRKR